VEHTNQIARCMTRPSVDPALLSGLRPQSARYKIPDDGRDLKIRFYQPVQDWQLVCVMFFPSRRCIQVASLCVDVIEALPSSSKCAFGDVVVVDAPDIGTRDLHAMISVRDAQFLANL